LESKFKTQTKKITNQLSVTAYRRHSFQPLCSKKDKNMETEIQLTEDELSRLERILACNDLSKQRKVALPFYIFGGIILLVGISLIFFHPHMSIVILPFAIVFHVAGMARSGYYKLFRIIHYQASQKQN